MTRKVTVAVFDKDLRATMKKYPLSTDGTRIEIKSGGAGHFMPAIDNNSFIELPRRKWLGGGYKRIYFVMKWAKKCVDFSTETVEGPDMKQMLDAVEKCLVDKIGKQKQVTNWLFYLILFLNFIILLKVIGVIA